MDSWRQTVHYRNQAEMLRDLAEKTLRTDHKEVLKRVATCCESMAATLERKLRSALTPA
jgi:hypothetical protein